MNEHDFAIMAAALGAACLLAGALGRRMGNERRDTRLMMGSGAALGGAALVLFSLARI
jgi:hypothetical protein